MNVHPCAMVSVRFISLVYLVSMMSIIWVTMGHSPLVIQGLPSRHSLVCIYVQVVLTSTCILLVSCISVLFIVHYRRSLFPVLRPCTIRPYACDVCVHSVLVLLKCLLSYLFKCAYDVFSHPLKSTFFFIVYTVHGCMYVCAFWNAFICV